MDAINNLPFSGRVAVRVCVRLNVYMCATVIKTVSGVLTICLCGYHIRANKPTVGRSVRMLL